MIKNQPVTAPNADKKFTIELKNVKTFIGNEGYGLNAMVYVNGIKCFFLIDDANGGSYNHEVYNKDLYNELKAYAESLPEKALMQNGMPITNGGKPWMMKQDIDSLCDEAFELYQTAKLIKKFEKQTINTIIWGMPDYSGSYTSVKLSKNIADIPQDYLLKLVKKYSADFKEGEVFYNKNLPSLQKTTDANI